MDEKHIEPEVGEEESKIAMTDDDFQSLERAMWWQSEADEIGKNGLSLPQFKVNIFLVYI